MARQPHAVCIPFPAQGHINAMMQLAKLLHFHGFHITFVHTQFNYKRILKTQGPSSLDGLLDFRFAAITTEGLDTPEDDDMEAQDHHQACAAVMGDDNLVCSFRDLLCRLNGDSVVSCVVSDSVILFPISAAKQLGIPVVAFVSPSACGYLGFLYYRQLVDRGLAPLRSKEDLTNGYLDTPVEFIAGLKNVRLRDLSSLAPGVDSDEYWSRFMLEEILRVQEASAIVLNTFDDLEGDAIRGISRVLGDTPAYAVGPLTLMLREITPKNPADIVGTNHFWKGGDDHACLEWLDGRKPGSVLYVNFGSLATLTSKQLVEFAWGVANSGYDFLWVIRSNLVAGEEDGALPTEFVKATEGRGFLAGWCPQEQVLFHPAVGGFLTHCGWNSTMESISAGVPMLCWPFFPEQRTTCRYSCAKWGIGMEVEGEVRREAIEELIRELMEGEKGKEMRKKVQEWKELAVEATGAEGSSSRSLKEVIEGVLVPLK